MLTAKISVALFLLTNSVSANVLPVKFSWPTVEFKYDDDERMDSDIRSGIYNPFNVIILDADLYNDELQGPIKIDPNRIYYVTTPALLPGSPVTLSKVTADLDSNGRYLLEPFPNWSWQNRSSCDGIISVFRIKIDKLGRMWVIDSGTVDVFAESYDRICPPKLIAFDLKRNDVLLTKFEFPENQLVNDSLLLNLEVQIINEDGSNTVVYLADTAGDRILVYHLQENKSYMFQHPYFKADPNYVNFKINGASFNLSDGVFNLALDEAKDVVYFHSLSSGYECYVKGNVLRKRTALTEEDIHQFKLLPFKKKMHTSCAVVTNKSILIFATLENNALYAWNSKKAYSGLNFKIIAKSNVTLQFPSGMKVVNDELLVTTSRLQNAIAKERNELGENFRILKGKLSNLLVRGKS